jgi:hypothetical protein
MAHGSSEPSGGRIIDDDGCPMFSMELGDYSYGFSVAGFPKDDHKWLCDVLGRQMYEIHERAYRRGRNEAQQAMRDALGIKQ